LGLSVEAQTVLIALHTVDVGDIKHDINHI
jgi:hypothetical protein